jgi:uncharacterized protein with beta-barrel porin domain
VKTSRTVPLHDGATLELRGGVAWAHDYWTGTEVKASFQALQGSPSFVVRGATPPSDSFFVTAGAEIHFQIGVALATRFDGGLAQRSRTYAAMARISHSW